MMTVGTVLGRKNINRVTGKSEDVSILELDEVRAMTAENEPIEQVADIK